MEKRKNLWMTAAILICGAASVFTSCTNEDTPADPADNLSEKIMGKWMKSEQGFQAARRLTTPTLAWSSSMTARTNTTVRTTADSGKP